MPIAKEYIKPGTATALAKFLIRAAEDDENAREIHCIVSQCLKRWEGKPFTLREAKKVVSAIQAEHPNAEVTRRTSYSSEYVDVIGGKYSRRVSVCLPRDSMRHFIDSERWEDDNRCTGTAAEARAKRCRYLLDNPGQINALASAIDGVRKAWALLDFALSLRAEADQGGFEKHEHPLQCLAPWLTGLKEHQYERGSADDYYAKACGLDPDQLRRGSFVLQLSKGAE